MKPGLSFWTASAVLALSVLEPRAGIAGRHLREPASDRGIAIMSPVESPDPCEYPVGGCYRYTPYYPGYAPPRRCPMIYGASTADYGTYSSGVFGNTPAAPGRSDYGAFTGANKDEQSLLRLGGLGAGPSQPYQGRTVDLIDRIHGYR